MTANGRPSGIATTTIETPRIKYLKIYRMNCVLHPLGIRSSMTSLIVSARNTRMAAATPNFPIFATNLSSFISSGVY